MQDPSLNDHANDGPYLTADVVRCDLSSLFLAVASEYGGAFATGVHHSTSLLTLLSVTTEALGFLVQAGVVPDDTGGKMRAVCEASASECSASMFRAAGLMEVADEVLEVAQELRDRAARDHAKAKAEAATPTTTPTPTPGNPS
jgi:hypothetical protein